MQDNEIENKIGKRFDELAGIFPEDINRDDVRVQTALEFFGNVREKKILDAGCGKGRFSKILHDEGALVTGLDLSDELLKSAKNNFKGINFIKASVTKINFPDCFFDFILSVEVIEHVPDHQKAISEMIRVLKKGGKIIIIDKNILSLHRKFLLPNVLLKKYMELTNKWFYPTNFQFKEKWFFWGDIDKIFKKYCRESKADYIKTSEKKLFSFLPFLNLFIGWKGIK